jgi:hypothetical protein
MNVRTSIKARERASWNPLPVPMTSRVDMQNVGKRLEPLESSLWSKRGPGTRAKIVTQALRHLSLEELCFLEGILEDSEDGKTQRDLTREESDAVAASKRALEFECKHAGFSSFAEFERWDHRPRRLHA